MPQNLFSVLCVRTCEDARRLSDGNERGGRHQNKGYDTGNSTCKSPEAPSQSIL